MKRDLCMGNEPNAFEPFQYYKEKTYLIYKSEGFSEERIKERECQNDNRFFYVCSSFITVNFNFFSTKQR